MYTNYVSVARDPVSRVLVFIKQESAMYTFGSVNFEAGSRY